MRVNIYAEELTRRLEIISKTTKDGEFTGMRFYLELPVTLPNTFPPTQVSGPFIHNADDDDSSAVTFWGKRDLRLILRQALDMLDDYYDSKPPGGEPGGAPGSGLQVTIKEACDCSPERIALGHSAACPLHRWNKDK